MVKVQISSASVRCPQQLPQQVLRLEGEAEVIRCCSDHRSTSAWPLCEGGVDESGNGARLLEAGGPPMWPIPQCHPPRGAFP
jgi:hypothetical protein